MYSPTQQDFNLENDHFSSSGMIGTPHTTVGAVPVVRNSRLFNPSYQLHQRQNSFGTVASIAMSPPNRAGGLPYDNNNSQNWFGTSLDSNTSSFGQSPIFTGIVSPSASTGHLDNYTTNDDEEVSQKNLQEIFEKRRRRRESHNAVERRRRDNINERIQELCTLLPERLIESAPTSSNVMSVSNGQANTNGRAINKGTILKLSVDHIKELREEVAQYQERIRELEQMIEAAKRGEMVKDENTKQQACSFNNNPTNERSHQRMGSLQFNQQFNNLQIGSNHHGRAMIPCQDSPSVKVTYSASVTSPLPVVMSALQIGNEEASQGLTTYHFEQRTTIPSYLIAIAVGNLVGREIGPRSTVWCEPEMIEKAAWEFSDTESFIAAGEALLTPYEWGRYDLLVLPPSFPYGGMENPCLTFVTPTLLAGDKSAVNVIAHEIAHSWMGNLVTTNSWKHYWLNEGWTVFVERKILGHLYGEATRQFEALSGLKSLQEDVDLYGSNSPKTVLNPDLSGGADPDDFFSEVPYEKGFNFLYHIEKVVGGPSIFEPFMKAYVENFASTSISTEDWKDFLFHFMGKVHGSSMIEKLNTIDFDTWINKPGMPPVDNEFDRTLANACINLAIRWDKARDQQDLSQFTSKDVENFSASQKIVFLERLTDCKPLPHHLISKMDDVYRLTPNRNADLRLRWQQVCLMADYEPIYSEVVKFVTEQGRMKFVRPLYRLLHQAKNGAQLAVDTYLKNKSFYHPIAAQLIEKDIGLTKS